MVYFGAGLWHFATAMAFAAAIGALDNGDPLHWLRQPLFTLLLVVSSSALFAVPDVFARRGLMKFLHYPLPDWDVLLLGPASHRNWLSHSPLLAAGILYLDWRQAQFFVANSAMTASAVGLCVGIGSHLFWDCVGSQSHKIVVVPHWFALREAPSRLYLLTGAVISLVAAAHLAHIGRVWR